MLISKNILIRGELDRWIFAKWCKGFSPNFSFLFQFLVIRQIIDTINWLLIKCNRSHLFISRILYRINDFVRKQTLYYHVNNNNKTLVLIFQIKNVCKFLFMCSDRIDYDLVDMKLQFKWVKIKKNLVKRFTHTIWISE